MDELTALAVKVRDGFACRAPGCRKVWQPQVRENGKVIVGEDCHWAHIIPRARGLAVRHEIENGLTLCFSHHKEFDRLKDKARLDFLKMAGVSAEQFFALEAQSRMLVTQFDGQELSERMLFYLMEQLKHSESLSYYREEIAGYHKIILAI